MGSGGSPPALIGLACGFGALLAFALYTVVKNALLARRDPNIKEDSPGWMCRTWFHRCIFVATLARICAIVLEMRRGDDELGDDTVSSFANTVLHTAPSLAFFTTYSLLIVFWGQLVFVTDSRGSVYIWRGFLALNAALYLVYVGKAVYTAKTKEYEGFAEFVYYSFGSIDAVTALGFVYFGGKVFRKLSRREGSLVTYHTRSRVLCRLVAISVVCTLTYVLRSVYAFLVGSRTLQHAYPRQDLPHLTWEALYFTLAELLPSVITVTLTMTRDAHEEQVQQYSVVGNTSSRATRLINAADVDYEGFISGRMTDNL